MVYIKSFGHLCSYLKFIHKSCWLLIINKNVGSRCILTKTQITCWISMWKFLDLNSIQCFTFIYLDVNMLEKSNSQYDSFLFWRQPIPALDLSELEDLGLVDHSKPKNKMWSQDEVRRVLCASWALSIYSLLFFIPSACLIWCSPAGGAVRVLLLQLLESSNRRCGLSAGWPQPAALKPSHPRSDPHPFIHTDQI